MTKLFAFISVFLLTFTLTMPTLGQEVDEDEVNRIANRLYCPVCPNETLDACRTEACAQWRGEIRTQLSQGATEAEIVDNFIARFGERVIGSPQDPTLRALAIVVPIIAILIGGVLGISTFMRWRGRTVIPATAADAPPLQDDPYRTALEEDLK